MSWMRTLRSLASRAERGPAIRRRRRHLLHEIRHQPAFAREVTIAQRTDARLVGDRRELGVELTVREEMSMNGFSGSRVLDVLV